MDNVFLFITFHSLLIGSVEQGQEGGNRKYKKIKKGDDDNKGEITMHISKDFTTVHSVKLETEGMEQNCNDDIDSITENFDIFKREIENQEDPFETENSQRLEAHKYFKLNKYEEETKTLVSESTGGGDGTDSDCDNHQKSEDGRIKYKCKHCDYQTSQKYNFLRHQKSVHKGIKYECNQCDYQASQKYNLVRHQESVHEGIKYKCNQCDYQASLKYNLVRHKKSIHEGEKT